MRYGTIVSMIRIIATIVLAIFITGCNLQPVHVRALPRPAVEQPVCNLPASLHQRNELGPLGQGAACMRRWSITCAG